MKTLAAARRSPNAPARRLALMLLAAIGVWGCASQPKPQPVLIDFLGNDRVTQTEVVEHLGTAYTTYEKGHVLAYRLSKKPQGYIVIPAPKGDHTGLAWKDVDYDLMLAFGDEGVLREHNLVSIHDAPLSK
jgi:hypothetical protein